MTLIPDKDRDFIERAIYLPMVLTILNRDLITIQRSPFKLKNPYIELIQETMKSVQVELTEVNRFLRLENIKVSEMKRDEAFTIFSFFYKGYEESHKYFNPRIRNRVEELLKYYLSGQYRTK